jgi:two-component system sensor histidine kinase BaeS
MWRKDEVLPTHLNPLAAAVQDVIMRSLFAKILVAQVITVVLALLVVMLVSRASLNRGFVEFLERQEAAVLDITAPALAELYQAQGGWDFLRAQPENWLRVLRHTRGQRGPGPNHPGGRLQRGVAADLAGAVPFEPPLRWLGSMDRLQLRERLFLLDADRAYLAGAAVDAPVEDTLHAVRSDGATVGWIGFAPMGKVLPPEAQRFLMGQLRVLSASLLIALGLAGLLAFLLARHLSRPVRDLAGTVTRLSRGQYEMRAAVAGRDETAHLARTVNQLAENLEKSRSARRRWMADIAHELRTPVSILKGEVEALADGVREPDARVLSSLVEEVDHLAALVDDLQTLALSDAGALNLLREPTELCGLLRQVAEGFRERLAARGIALQLDLPQQATVMADAQRLRQLLQNLLENSARYVEQDGWVKITVTAMGGGARIAVEDSGPGVSDEQLQRLFERFYRAEEGRSRAGGGSGLGLSICRNIVEAHGGSIRAAHGDFGGLAIQVDLPGGSQ